MATVTRETTGVEGAARGHYFLGCKHLIHTGLVERRPLRRRATHLPPTPPAAGAVRAARPPPPLDQVAVAGVGHAARAERGLAGGRAGREADPLAGHLALVLAHLHGRVADGLADGGGVRAAAGGGAARLRRGALRAAGRGRAAVAARAQALAFAGGGECTLVEAAARQKGRRMHARAGGRCVGTAKGEGREVGNRRLRQRIAIDGETADRSAGFIN